jgi:ATP-dependent DNA ligase
MSLPIAPPYLPMEAQTAAKLPEGEDWQYEPKWDGFRCILFRDHDHVEVQSKSAQPLARYFPELVAACLELKPKTFVLDGEIVIPSNGKLSFDDLLQRIHPAASRIQKLSVETPSQLIVFDLLVDEQGKLVADLPLRERRPKLDAFAGKYLDAHNSFQLSPATSDVKIAQKWLKTLDGTLDGVIAKRLELPYQTGERTGMVKIKNLRTADCVVGGFRYAEKAPVVGSLLLGLYDDDGLLHHVGFTSAIAAAEKAELTKKLEALRGGAGFTGKAPGGPSRWSTERSAEWQPLKPQLVVEVRYDHFTGGRFRHGTRLERWRPDKAPGQCLMTQVQH